MKNINIAILGATGMVGQRFVELLANHPYLKIKALLASENSAGQKYSKAVNWLISREVPKIASKIIIQEVKPVSLKDKNIEIVFSALPSQVAKEVEPEFAKVGFKVFSNASAFRMAEDVPLVVTEINASHMRLVKHQQKNRNWPGFIITNPNCSTIIAVLVLKPLYDAFGLEKAVISTMQAVSGSGYPGVASLDIIDNVLPFIGGEEEKIEQEPLKILGLISSDQKTINNADLKISASCQRVAAVDGHLEDLHISLEKSATIDEIKKVLYSFKLNLNNLPTAPKQVIIVQNDPMRPQPKLDRMAGDGMSVTVGRIRKDPVFKNGIKMTVLGHNTIRGAAGQSILNAEWWVSNQNI